MPQEKWRINLILILIFLFAIAILARLFFIQILNHSFYKALAEGQQKSFIEVEGDRGEIFLKDKNNNLYLLATNVSRTFCYLRPEKIIDREKTAKILSEIFKFKAEEIKETLEKISQEKIPFFLLKEDLTEDELKRLRKENLPGVYFERKRIRFYPQENLASQTIGFLGGEGEGQYGIEGFYDEILQGKKSWLVGEKGYFGISDENIAGANLILTLDFYLQKKADELLSEAVGELKAEGGEILVISPETGKIFALSNFPNFNLNQYSKIENQEIFKNNILQSLFEPGSVFKPIVIAAALEEGKITPETTYEDKGFLQFGKERIYNYDRKVWGKQTMKEVLEKSINTGAVFAESLIGDKKFFEYIERFGFFQPTDIDLQGEVWSENKTLKQGRPINFATASFGQGVEVTSIQLARAFSAIANGGKLIRPYIVEKIIKNGAEILEVKPKIQRENLISSNSANQLTEMLVSVVEEGFAKRAKVPGYYIAGKTGTAQVPFAALGIAKAGYSEKTIQTFVGFFPAFNPRFLILVKLNNPQTKTAEYSAVPLFQKLAKYIIDYYQISPDYIEE